jgi:hypothetical protein
MLDSMPIFQKVAESELAARWYSVYRIASEHNEAGKANLGAELPVGERAFSRGNAQESESKNSVDTTENGGSTGRGIANWRRRGASDKCGTAPVES